MGSVHTRSRRRCWRRKDDRGEKLVSLFALSTTGTGGGNRGHSKRQLITDAELWEPLQVDEPPPPVKSAKEEDWERIEQIALRQELRKAISYHKATTTRKRMRRRMTRMMMIHQWQSARLGFEAAFRRKKRALQRWCGMVASPTIQTTKCQTLH